MTDTGQDVGTSGDPYYEGDTLEIIVDVTEDGSAKDLTNSSASWEVSKGPDRRTELSGSDSGVDVSITDAANGEVTITVDEGATDGMVGAYHHQLRVTDSVGDKAVVTTGRLEIGPRPG